MEELHKIISEITFKSFCRDVTLQDESSLEFKLKHSYHGNRVEEIFCIQKIDSGLILSDKGSTLANLDDIFELSEPDVIKNIIAVLRQFSIQKEGIAFTYKINSIKDITPQILHYMQDIHFLYGMKLFYV